MYKKLIDSADEPVLFYCAGIWGNRHFTKVENVIIKACRYFWELAKMRQIYLEKVISADVKQKQEMVRLWCRLRNMPEDRTIRKIHDWSFNIVKF